LKNGYSFDTLAQRLRELAFLNKGLKITLTTSARKNHGNLGSPAASRNSSST